MGKRIVFVGVGALGGYVSGHLTRAGHDVTLIDSAAPKVCSRCGGRGVIGPSPLVRNVLGIAR